MAPKWNNVEYMVIQHNFGVMDELLLNEKGSQFLRAFIMVIPNQIGNLLLG